MSADPLEIYVPGRGMVNPQAERVNDAVKQEDERLRFGFNPKNKDWIIYILMPRDFDAAYYIEGEPVYPVLGFGDRIPSPDEAVRRLREVDTRRTDVRKAMNKANDARAHAREKEAQDWDAEMAERIEFELRKKGQSPISRVYFQLKDR